MKKLFILNFLMLCAIVTHAQLSKGTVQIGGLVSYSRTSNDYEFSPPILDDSKSSTLTISPRAGIFISDKSVIGLGIEYSRDMSDGTYSSDFGVIDTKTIINVFAFGPYYRFYKSLGTNAALFLHAEATVGFGNQKLELDSEPDFHTNTFIFRAAASPGITFFITEKWGLEGSIGLLSYHRVTVEPDDEDDDEKYTSDQFDFNLNLSSFSLGVQYFLAR